jgi:GNAT superfamily N-acetyltransferase
VTDQGVGEASLPELRDLEPGDAKARAAIERFRIRRVTSAESADFAAGYGALWDEFGRRGELERREVVERWLARGAAGIVGEGLHWQYHLLVARDETASLAGVRDCHVTVDVARLECVIYLAHTLVLPDFRRGGLASLFRAAPLTLARRALADLGVASADVLLAAEMEPAERAASDTLVRLVAYGKTGFRVVPPAVLPYCQPDFRDLAAIGEAARPLPLLAVVRWIDHPDAAALPARLCEAYVRHLYAVFSTHCRATDLTPSLTRSLDILRRAAIDPVPLLPLPSSDHDDAALAPLLREEVLGYLGS